MTEVLISIGSIFLGWGASVEYRLGQLMKMSRDIEKTADRVDKIYDLVAHNEGPTEEGPNKGRRSSETSV